jgi:hypothetical protein
MERLPKALHALVRRALPQACELDHADKAEKLLQWKLPAAMPMRGTSGCSSACAKSSAVQSRWWRKQICSAYSHRVTFRLYYAWRERRGHLDLWVVRKGATPAFPGQRGFVGGSIGDDAVVIEGIDSEESRAALYSTVHGAGRLFGRKEAKRRFTRAEMDAWLRDRGVVLIGADLDESPMAYRRLRRHGARAAHATTFRCSHGRCWGIRSMEGLASFP